ncbi:MAG: hypothetical protein JWN61_1743 [Pseudonocardiales bacterium]|nr:hypothetical protein [Pseudonocardiales bacterium]
MTAHHAPHHTENRRRRAAWRPVAVAAVGAALVVGTGFGVWASLNATATGTAETVSSGTLKLTLAANGVGFSQGITNVAPGDIVNRYVDLANSGTLDAQSLTVQVGATGSGALITDGVAPATTKALRVTITSCTTNWAPTTGICSGTTSIVLAATPVSGLSTAASLIAGAIPAGTVAHLQVSTQLPDQTETTVNGNLPATTIQGQSAVLAYTFGEVQRTSTTTNS